MLTGVGLGGATVTLVLIVIRLLQWVELARYGESISQIDPTWALIGAIVVGAFFAWRRSHPLSNPWQRAVICTLSVFGALFIAILGAPVWHFLQFAGLGVLFATSLVVGVMASRWAVRGAEGSPPQPDASAGTGEA